MKKGRKKWTIDALRDSASKYSSLKEWRKSEKGAYVTASRLGLLDELTQSMTKLIEHGYWTAERIKESALKYQHKGQWARAEQSAYNAASRLGIFEEVTAHMVPLGNRKSRCIYSITVTGTNFVYIGLTGNFKRRIRDHLETTRFVSLAAQYGTESIVATQLTDYVASSEAQHKEAEFIAYYSANGYQLLNKAKAGALGGVAVKWTSEAILEEAKKYSAVMDWVFGSPQSYAAASAHRLIEAATAHMERQIKAPGSWTREKIVEITSRFKSVKEWIIADQKSYQAAQRLRLLDDPDVGGHLAKYQQEPRKWPKPEVLRDAKRYASKSAWKVGNSGAYKAARAGGYFDEAVAHMATPKHDVFVRKGEQKLLWTVERVVEDAANYSTKPEWKAASSGAYMAARRLGCFEQATAHMSILNPKGKWSTKQAVLADARNYQTRAEWGKKSCGAYEAAKKNGWFNEAIAHMKVLRRRKGAG
jgi:predicted GIY-YIG superfamily endonuclease